MSKCTEITVSRTWGQKSWRNILDLQWQDVPML